MDRILAFVLHQIRYMEDVLEGKKTVKKEVVVQPGGVHEFPAAVHAELKNTSAIRPPTETEAALHQLTVNAKAAGAKATAEPAPKPVSQAAPKPAAPAAPEPEKTEPEVVLASGKTGEADNGAGNADDESL